MPNQPIKDISKNSRYSFTLKKGEGLRLSKAGFFEDTLNLISLNGKFILILLFVLNFSMHGFGQSQDKEVRGIVFLDKNGNGIKDRDEAGVVGVAVSNQLEVTKTNEQGVYLLKSTGRYNLIFVSTPTGYACKDFWRKIPTGSTAEHHFALQAVASPASFTFIHASDTHISEQSLDRVARLRSIVESAKPDFMLVTGDLVKDALRVGEKEATGYYQHYVREMTSMPVPVFSVPGNHENFGIERHLSLVPVYHPLYGKKMYHHYLGPNYYSFNYGGVHFIGLDDVDFEDMWYFGRVDSVQVAWLKNDLLALEAGTPVVTFAHMALYSGGLGMGGFEEQGAGRTLERQNGKPFFRHIVSNAQELMEIMASHPYPLSLAGHFHARQVFWYETGGRKTSFEQASAVIGPGGVGKIKIPSGVTLYRFQNGQFNEGVFIPLDN